MYASFPPELNTVFDAGLAKYGPVELAKRFMFHYMRENGVTYGDAWQCVMDLSESSFEEAYSAAGKTWFGWWLVEHYLSYHVNCPNSCDSGEPARGRKDPPYFQMGYGSFDHIADLVDTLVESFLPVQ